MTALTILKADIYRENNKDVTVFQSLQTKSNIYNPKNVSQCDLDQSVLRNEVTYENLMNESIGNLSPLLVFQCIIENQETILKDCKGRLSNAQLRNKVSTPTTYFYHLSHSDNKQFIPTDISNFQPFNMRNSQPNSDKASKKFPGKLKPPPLFPKTLREPFHNPAPLPPPEAYIGSEYECSIADWESFRYMNESIFRQPVPTELTQSNLSTNSPRLNDNTTFAYLLQTGDLRKIFPDINTPPIGAPSYPSFQRKGLSEGASQPLPFSSDSDKLTKRAKTVGVVEPIDEELGGVKRKRSILSTLLSFHKSKSKDNEKSNTSSKSKYKDKILSRNSSDALMNINFPIRDYSLSSQKSSSQKSKRRATKAPRKGSAVSFASSASSSLSKEMSAGGLSRGSSSNLSLAGSSIVRRSSVGKLVNFIKHKSSMISIGRQKSVMSTGSRMSAELRDDVDTTIGDKTENTSCTEPKKVLQPPLIVWV